MEDCKVSDGETISLVIKTPNQFHGDHLVEGVRVDWTVKDLKCHPLQGLSHQPGRFGLVSCPVTLDICLHLASRQHSSTDTKPVWLNAAGSNCQSFALCKRHEYPLHKSRQLSYS